MEETKICILLLSVLVVSLASNNGSYCVVDINNPGLFVPYISENHSTFSFTTIETLFSDVTTKSLHLNATGEWKKLHSINNSEVNQPVFDKRWETFTNSHDATSTVVSLIKTNNTFFFSILGKKYENTSLLSNEWNLMKSNNSEVYKCNIKDYYNCRCFSNNTSNFYASTGGSTLWKIHEYNYLYTENETETEIYKPSENCTIIQNGCIYVYVTMCKNCSMDLFVNNTIHNITSKEVWTMEKILLENFWNCSSIKVKTKTNDSSTNKFWAIGDVIYFSSNYTCKENKRYINITQLATKKKINETELYCQNAENENITFSEFPVPERFAIKNESDTPDTPKASFEFVYYLFVIPAIVIPGLLVGLIWFKSNSRANTSSANAYFPNNNSESVQLLNLPQEPSIVSKKDWPPIKRNDFESYVHDVCGPNRKKEYLKIQFDALPSGYLKPYEEGRKPENQEKNRFGRIYPYDENRVKLEKNLDDKGNPSDYINASYIQGFNDPKEYIVTQNPIKGEATSTVTDFWRMIWQEKIEYIVMISGNDEKYHTYWPEFNKFFCYDNINLTVYLENVEAHEFYYHRTMLVKRYDETRTVNQLHFHCWSNEMLSTHIFLDFINHLLKIPHGAVPVLYHCMAGVGRSATILLCDIALRTVAISGSFNLFQITKQMRECRANMVQNWRQYQLAHLIILESLTYKDLSVEINLDYEAQFSRVFEGNTTKRMWSEYLENKEWMYEAVTPYIIYAKYPKRNRYNDNNLLPFEHSRVVLQYKQPDYIHAMYVYGFKQTKSMIVAQQPLHGTVHDFWIMILQSHVSTIINVHELDPRNPEDTIFYPTFEKQVMKLPGNIVIRVDSEENNYNYDKFGITIIYSAAKNERKISLINVKNWPRLKAVPESTDIMISMWEVAKGEKVQNFPILICCNDGVTSSSLVACFYYMADKMIRQLKCDIVGAVRAVRRTHTNFITFEQFIFLHHCALAFYKNCLRRYFQNK